MEAKDLLDAAQEDLDLARTAGAKAAAKKKVDELQAKYDEEYNAHKELQKQYNDAKAAAATEEQITAFSLGIRDLANIRDLIGNVHSKEVDIKVTTKDGATKDYRLYMRMYDLRDEALNLHHLGQWKIIKFEPLS
jgi:IS1 family transposase